MKNSNRSQMPTIAGVVDMFREIFGEDQVKVSWCQENKIELGKRLDESKMVCPAPGGYHTNGGKK